MRQAAQPAPGRASSRRIIERPRLLKLLDEAAARTILLIAPAGYGKTTLARQWAERHQSVHWYTARTGSADVAQLAVDLAGIFDEALQKYVSQLVRAHARPNDQVQEITDGFAAAARRSAPTWLCIDDYQLIAVSPVADWFIHELQAQLGFKLLIASRVRPSWASARLEIYRETAELGADDLALTDGEAHEVLGEARYSDQLLSQARGWPAVVGLAAKTSTTLSPPHAGASTLFRFFAEELFFATPPSTQDRLIALALLPSLAKPLIETALGLEADQVVEGAIESGLATPGPEHPELHPLVQEYLLSKLQDVEQAEMRVRSAFDTSLRTGCWEHAASLIQRFPECADLLTPLLVAAFKPLVAASRIATLETIANLGRRNAEGAVGTAIELIDAELAFRNGLFERATAIAVRVATALDENHPLASHAWWLAGMATQMSFDDARAVEYFEHAGRAAHDDDDRRDALWGLAIAACQSEQPDTSDALRDLAQRREDSAVDYVRAATASLHMWRIGIRAQPLEIERALHELQKVEDPRIQTGFLNQYAYDSVLWANYEDAYEIAQGLRELIEQYRLSWARPHAEWALAAAALGRRQFALADRWLRKVEHAAEQLKYGQLILNSSCVRCRILLALGRPAEAQSSLCRAAPYSANPAMRGEYVAMQALVLAVLGEVEEAASHAAKARETTLSVEAHAYAACADAISALEGLTPASEPTTCVEVSHQLGIWDAFVTAVRAWPPLLEAIAARGGAPASVVDVLRRSNDYDLARKAGIDLGRKPIDRGAKSLSPRERDVVELLRQGFTNAEIAKALFISVATVKVHVEHVLDKTGARSRTEVAAMDWDV